MGTSLKIYKALKGSCFLRWFLDLLLGIKSVSALSDHIHYLQDFLDDQEIKVVLKEDLETTEKLNEFFASVFIAEDIGQILEPALIFLWLELDQLKPMKEGHFERLHLVLMASTWGFLKNSGVFFNNTNMYLVLRSWPLPEV